MFLSHSLGTAGCKAALLIANSGLYVPLPLLRHCTAVRLLCYLTACQPWPVCSSPTPWTLLSSSALSAGCSPAAWAPPRRPPLVLVLVWNPIRDQIKLNTEKYKYQGGASGKSNLQSGVMNPGRIRPWSWSCHTI